MWGVRGRSAAAGTAAWNSKDAPLAKRPISKDLAKLVRFTYADGDVNGCGQLRLVKAARSARHIAHLLHCALPVFRCPWFGLRIR